MRATQKMRKRLLFSWGQLTVLLVLIKLLVSTSFQLLAQDFSIIEKRVTEFTLPNGMHFIIYERHGAPVVSFHTFVNAGAVDDPKGKTGLAHMFEHMAFKGTDKIGTKNYAEEKKLLNKIEELYDQLDQELRKRFERDENKIHALRAQIQKLVEEAEKYVVPNEFPKIIEENGGVGLNASTGMDSTNYYVSLPSNRVELWFYLESERFKHPVFRQFYKERDVVREERRMRIESNPQGKLLEALLSTAFAAHPYKNWAGGWASDIESLRATDARQFFETYYGPENITVAIAGDVDPDEMRRLAQKYFGDIKPRWLPPIVNTVEPKQEGEKRVVVETTAQPFLIVAFKRPDHYHPDDPIFDVISGLLSYGRTGILYRELVQKQKLALAATAIAAFPGSKYPPLFVIYVVPNRGRTVKENEKAVNAILESLKNEGVNDESLEKVKTQIRAQLLRQLDSNAGMAAQLAFFHANFGNWRKMLDQLKTIEQTTNEEVKRVARTYFIPSARTVAYTVQPERAGAAEEKAP